jgi:L-2-hydroxyglutarate oxidase LhgO
LPAVPPKEHSPPDRTEVAVIGAGVIGLAVARALAMRGREVLLLEAEETFGTGISSRNSEVIHAGIYYPRDSLKAKFCTEGRDRLYEFCERFGVAHRRCGKLIVAPNEIQVTDLRQLRETAAANGVELEWLDEPQARAMEPQLRCRAALYSPLTGIIDSHQYMLTLLGHAEHHGATLVCNSRVTRMSLRSSGTIALAVNDGEPSMEARLVINCAGFYASALAAACEGFPAKHVPETWFAKGNYFTLSGRAPFTHLVYPIPEPGGLGVHVTLDLAGRARFGPDVEWVQQPDYAVDARRAERFFEAIRTYWPALPDGALLPGYAGIRPKLSGPGRPNADFRIDGHAQHGVPQLIHLFGIESPGLTASLAIAEYVAELAAQQLDS